jgi:DNA-binding HxlR family transcriptional regulator
MTEDYDRGKIIEHLFNPDVSVILAELENGSKESSYLADKLAISEQEIKTRLDYLIEAGFVKVSNSPLSYAVDAEKLAKVMESDEHYKGVVDGLAELDSYLN